MKRAFATTLMCVIIVSALGQNASGAGQQDAPASDPVQAYPPGQNRPTADPCASTGRGEIAHWQTYVDRQYRFCFRYPKVYIRVRPSSGLDADRHPESSCVLMKRTDASDVINVCPSNQAFNVPITNAGSTDIRPQHFRIGQHTFYYFGGSRQGSACLDVYYVNARGEFLTIAFQRSSPSQAKNCNRPNKIERQILATLRVF